MTDEKETVRKFAAAISRGVERSAAELNLGADGVCAAMLGVLVETAQKAGITRPQLADWLRDVAAWMDGDLGPGDLPPPPSLH